ncbi:MAG: sigma-70 family RNA polymerase sigma factor [Verrucomicrobia bacterium]|nr:MAG: sigma-70 family RNA polymerase sigma factor [Verrucomicrobiota bacterium]
MLYSLDQQTLSTRPTTPVGEPTDEVLMERIQARDDKAIAILYRRHTPLLRSVIGRILNNDCDVDDLLQVVFLEVWRQAAHYDEAKGKALGWIVTLARRRAIDKVRTMQTYFRAQERLREEPEPAPHLGADEEAAASDTAKIFSRVLATLPVLQREALDFAFYRGMSQREIAAHTGIPLGTIKTRLELALRKVRTAIVALGGASEWTGAAA